MGQIYERADEWDENEVLSIQWGWRLIANGRLAFCKQTRR